MADETNRCEIGTHDTTEKLVTVVVQDGGGAGGPVRRRACRAHAASFASVRDASIIEEDDDGDAGTKAMDGVDRTPPERTIPGGGEDPDDAPTVRNETSDPDPDPGRNVGGGQRTPPGRRS